MRLLLTRPQEDSEALADLLGRRGIDTAIAPLLTIRYYDDAVIILDGIQGLLVTSANGVRAFARRTDRRDFPVYTVGQASAGAARDLGFSQIESAGGDVDDLATLVRTRVDPAQGALLHVAGTKIAGDLKGMLEKAGIDYRRAVLYEAQKAEALAPQTVAGIRAGDYAGTVFYSPRTAANFATLAKRAGVTKQLRAMTAFCLSPAVAGQLAGAGFGTMATAARPEQEALMDQILKHKESTTQGTTIMDNDTTAVPADPAEARPAPAVKKSRGGGFALFLLLLIVLGAAGYMTQDRWWSQAEPYVARFLPAAPESDPAIAGNRQAVAALRGDVNALSPRTDALDDRIGQLEAALATQQAQLAAIAAQLAAVVAQPAALPAIDPAVLADLDRRIGALEARPVGPVATVGPVAGQGDPTPAPSFDTTVLDGLAARLDDLAAAGPAGDAALHDQIQQLDRRLAQVEQAASQSAAQPDPAIILALGQLRGALSGSGIFVAELAAFESLAGPDPAVAAGLGALRAHADSGLPALPDLRAAFDRLSGEIVTAAVVPPQDGWAGRTLDALSSLVKVRRVDGGLSGGAVDGVVARTKKALADNQLAAAVAALRSLDEGAARVAAPWIAQAEQRLGAEATLAALQAQVLSRLAATGG